MFDWVADLGQGIINIFTGKSWNGDDPNAIKQQAQQALQQQQQAYQDALEAQSDTTLKKTLVIMGVVGTAGFVGYQIFGKKGRRR